MPEEKIDDAVEYLSLLKKLSESELKYEIIAAKGTIQIKRNVFLEAISTFHATASCGYGISLKKHHLKDEFKGKSEQTIIEAKRAGITVDQEVVEKLVTFSGDTKGEFFETEAMKAKVLIMECSFFGDTSNYEKIRAYGHTHIKDWQTHADRIENEKVIMIHTSQRYSKRDIEASCRKNLPKDLIERIIVFR
jgi:ribonuclease Z